MLQSSYYYLSKVLLQKATCGYALVIKEKKSIEKNGQVSNRIKQWVLRCPPKKRDE
jgi:hypothetical protein